MPLEQPTPRFAPTLLKILLFVLLAAAVFAAGFGTSWFRSSPDAPGPSSPRKGVASSTPHSMTTPAVVLSVKGSFGMTRNTSTVLPAVIGQAVEPGDVVRAYPGGAAVFLTPEGLLHVLPAETVSYLPEGIDTTDLSSAFAFVQEAKKRFLSVKESGLPSAHSGIVIQQPLGRILFTTQPVFFWWDSQDAYPYHAVLRQGNQIVFDRRVQVPYSSGRKGLPWPKDLDPLRTDVPYRFEVTSSEGISASTQFECRRTSELLFIIRPAQKLAHTLADLVAVPVFNGVRLWRDGYLSRAIHEFRKANAHAPDARFPIECLVALYMDAGDTISARQWMRRADRLPIRNPLRVGRKSGPTDDRQ